jgi:hypothetical protein
MSLQMAAYKEAFSHQDYKPFVACSEASNQASEPSISGYANYNFRGMATGCFILNGSLT